MVPYLLSFKLAADHPPLATGIWDHAARIRESPQYKRTEQDFYAAN